MSDPAEKSPLAIFREYCNRGELAYQTADKKPFFYPRLAAPGTGSTDLEWEVSSGLGTSTRRRHCSRAAPILTTFR